MGETLALADRPAEAVQFYEAALKAESQPDNQAWLLYQLANCRRTTDPEGALSLYKRLLAEHPKSDWTEPAQTQARVLEWMLTARPREALTTQATGRLPSTSSAPAGGAP